MTKVDPVRAAWREANDKVRVVESRIARAWSDYAAGQGPPPPIETLTELSVARQVCDQKLRAVLAQLPGSSKQDRSSEDHPG